MLIFLHLNLCFYLCCFKFVFKLHLNKNGNLNYFSTFKSTIKSCKPTIKSGKPTIKSGKSTMKSGKPTMKSGKPTMNSKNVINLII